VLTASQRARFETLHAEWQIELQQADVERQRQEQKRKLEESEKTNQKPDQKPASTSDRRGRPGV